MPASLRDTRSLDIGALRHRFELQAPTETQNAAGEPILTWPPTAGQVLAVLPGDWQELGGAEAIAGDALFATRASRIRFRFSTLLRPKRRLKHLPDGRLLDIQSVNDPDGRRREHIVVAVERDV